MALDQVDVMFLVAEVLEKMGIPYCVCGSLASSLLGEWRSTRDVDLLADIKGKQVRPLSEALQSDFYAEEHSMIQAVKLRRSFNVIHSETLYKVDLFVSKGTEFEKKQLERRQLRSVNPEDQKTAYFATPEDTILAKLAWYRLGNEISDQQWRDVMGVVKLQRGKLDLEYLRHWSAELNVSDLFADALQEAGISE
jgi:hypothetical protein